MPSVHRTARTQDRFDTEVTDLWSALTDRERLARRFGEVDGDPRPGAEPWARSFAAARAARPEAFRTVR